jgi:hypothetical protein
LRLTHALRLAGRGRAGKKAVLFCKERTKKLLTIPGWRCRTARTKKQKLVFDHACVAATRAQNSKSFLVLFYKKELLSFF